jgi:hypothetical protein
MDVKPVRQVGNSKFMWDGEIYEGHGDAAKRKAEYEGKGFEVQMFEQEGKHLLYTRRVVKETAVAAG